MVRLSVAALLGLVAASGFAASSQAGCLTGAAIGGVAGHVAGHHGLLGAAAGCYVGHHEARVRREQEQAQREGYRTGPDRETYGRDAYRDDQR